MRKVCAEWLKILTAVRATNSNDAEIKDNECLYGRAVPPLTFFSFCTPLFIICEKFSFLSG